MSTLSELRAAAPPLRVVVAPDDGESFMGAGAAAVLRASGIDPQEILDWGGEFIHGEDPGECLELFKSQDADMVIQEAMMTPWWHDVAEGSDIVFLSLESDAPERLEADLGIGTITVEPGYLRGIRAPLVAADFRGWLVLVQASLPDDVAETLAAVLVETRSFFEHQYTHIPERFSPLSYPITAYGLSDTPIPLHPGAQRVYASASAE